MSCVPDDELNAIRWYFFKIKNVFLIHQLFTVEQNGSKKVFLFYFDFRHSFKTLFQ